MGYDVVRSNEWIIWSEMTFQSEQEDVVEVVVQISTGDIVSLCGLDSPFESSEGKVLMLLTTVSTCLNFSLLISSQLFWEYIWLNQYWS